MTAVDNLNGQDGFTLSEFLVSSCILLVVAAAAFALLSELQRTASLQDETHTILDNARIALDVASRRLRQAGNDPFGIGFTGIEVVSRTEVRVRSDLTGNDDRGDPDGDIGDSGEDVVLRHNPETRSFEIVTRGGAVQVLAGNISDMTFSAYDDSGAPASSGQGVRTIRVSVSGSSARSASPAYRPFGVRIESEVEALGNSGRL